MVNKEDTKRRSFEKIANMRLAAMPSEQIAKVMGVSASAISQIVKREDFLEVQQELFERDFRRQKEIADMWDDAEHKALTGIQDNMRWNLDPEFALRVAAVANKAHRRGSAQNGNQPLNADVGRTVHIQLSKIYVTQITGKDEGGTQGQAPVRQIENRATEKLSDNLSKSAVETLFEVDDKVEVAGSAVEAGLEAMFADVIPQFANG